MPAEGWGTKAGHKPKVPEVVEDMDQDDEALDLNEQQTEPGQSDHNSLPNTETVANEHSNKGWYIRVMYVYLWYVSMYTYGMYM